MDLIIHSYLFKSLNYLAPSVSEVCVGDEIYINYQIKNFSSSGTVPSNQISVSFYITDYGASSYSGGTALASNVSFGAISPGQTLFSHDVTIPNNQNNTNNGVMYDIWGVINYTDEDSNNNIYRDQGTLIYPSGHSFCND